MPFLRSFQAVLPAIAAACAGVAPDPAAASAAGLPVVELGEQDAARRDAEQQRAVLALAEGRPDEAADAAGRALDLDPRAARARAVNGVLMLRRAAAEDPPEWAGLRTGEAELRVARELAPQDMVVAHLHAVFLVESGHVSAAAVAAEEVLARAGSAPSSERAPLLGIAGACRYELGEERAALPHLQAYVALRPDDADAQYRLGAALLAIARVPQGIPPASLLKAQREAEAAARAFRRSADLRPGDEQAGLAVVAALVRAAELAEQRPDPGERDARRQEAGEALRALGERFPASAEVPFRVGVLASLQGEAEAARAAYSAALDRDPGHVGSALNLAAMLAASGEATEARALLERVLAAEARSRSLTRDERRRIERWLAGQGPDGQPSEPRDG